MLSVLYVRRSMAWLSVSVLYEGAQRNLWAHLEWCVWQGRGGVHVHVCHCVNALARQHCCKDGRI